MDRAVSVSEGVPLDTDLDGLRVAVRGAGQDDVAVATDGITGRKGKNGNQDGTHARHFSGRD
jgi:hypothetical protein